MSKRGSDEYKPSEDLGEEYLPGEEREGGESSGSSFSSFAQGLPRRGGVPLSTKLAVPFGLILAILLVYWLMGGFGQMGGEDAVTEGN